MKEQQLKAVRVYFKLLSGLSTKWSGTRAFWMMQKVRNKKIKSIEAEFYKQALPFTVPFPKENLNAYTLGDPQGKLLFLVHGLNSNAGSLTRLATEFVDLGYRVVSFDLPAHAFAKKKHTNLYECKEAFKAVINYVDPQQPFDIISHSLGSATTIYALSELSQPVNRMVLLTSPNATIDFFLEFKRIVGLNQAVFKEVLDRANTLAKEDISTMKVEDKLKHVAFDASLIIHDKRDKVIPFTSSQDIANSSSQVQLKSYENIGHYRMLWKDEVIQDAVTFLTN